MSDFVELILGLFFIAGLFALAFISYAFTAIIYASPLIAVLWLFGWLS